MRKRVVGLLLCLCASSGVLADVPPHCSGLTYPPPYNFQGEITPGISWQAWSQLLDVHWSRVQLKGVPYDAESVKQAIAAVMRSPSASHDLPDRYYADIENYMPPTMSTAAQRDAYEEAAKLYREAAWLDSIPKFDALVKDKSSPYRAAAAYTAARAALKAGLLNSAADRIQAILQDPSLAEFHAATYHLFGTMAGRAHSMPFIAGKYAEISHMVMAPSEVFCSDGEAHDFYNYQQEDLLSYLVRSRSMETPSNQQVVLDILSAKDPVLDLLRVLSAPTPFKEDAGWPHPASQTRPPHVLESSTAIGQPTEDAWSNADGAQLTVHARERWLKTHDLLWGYALAQRTADPKDLPILLDMMKRSKSLKHTQALDDARQPFYWQFMRQSVRLMVMSGHTEDALKLLTHDAVDRGTLSGTSRVNSNFLSEDARVILNGPVMWFLEDYDLPAAQHWAKTLMPLVPDQLNWQLVPLLETNWTVLAKHDQAKTPQFWSVSPVLDMLPAHKLAELSEMPGINADTRRSLLGTAFVRDYALHRWQDVAALLPRLRASFPELQGDIDQIDAVAAERQKQYLVAHMLLRNPGLVASVSYSRKLPNPGNGTDYGIHNLTAIDDANPNDGNWWCAPTVEEMKISLAQEFYGEALFYFYRGDRSNPQERQHALEVGNALLAWHPLLKDVDIDELQALAAAESGPQRLTEEALNWSHSVLKDAPLSGIDAQIPDALALAVRATRYGCRRHPLGALSNAAFSRLHTRFPKTPEALRTPYWFNYGGAGSGR